MVQIEGLIEHSESELELRAQAYHKRRPDVQFRIPVNVEALLENFPGIDVEPLPNLLLRSNHEGCIVNDNGPELSVYIDKKIMDSGPRPRYHAVIAEELAHLELHKSIFIQIKSLRDFFEVQRSIWWYRVERDARFFGLALRMPFQHVVLAAEQLYPEVVDEHGYLDAPSMEKLLRNAIADRFCVPQQDAQKRLMQRPYQVLERVRISTLEKSSRLLPAEWMPPSGRRRIQANLFD